MGLQHGDKIRDVRGGLKLESRDVTTQVLVIDHVEERPTEN